MKFVSAIQDDVLQYSLQDYMYFCGSRILDLFIIYYTKWNNITRANYYTALAKFKNNVSSEDFGNLETCLKRKIQKEKATLCKTHDNKLDRDKNKIKIRYKRVDETKLPAHITQRVKKNVRRRSRRLKKRKRPRKKTRTAIKGEILKVEEIPESKLKETVINLSDKITDLSPHQLYLFFLGESFAPTPLLPDYSKFRLDLLQFAYRMRWGWYWHQNPPKLTHRVCHLKH